MGASKGRLVMQLEAQPFGLSYQHKTSKPEGVIIVSKHSRNIDREWMNTYNTIALLVYQSQNNYIAINYHGIMILKKCSTIKYKNITRICNGVT
jgi:hypothetical protein